MALGSKIEWTNHTLNFWTGCTKVSPGCKYCYMYRDQERYGKEPTELVKVKNSTIKKVLNKALPGDKIFVCSWSDFFIEGADEWRKEAWEIIKNHPQFIFQILTKRPERMEQCLPDDWGEGYDNVWLGISVENQEMANLRMPILAMIDAKVKFLSIEPIVSKINLSFPTIKITRNNWSENFHVLPAFDWVIIGGESGNDNGKYKYRESRLEWYEDIVYICKCEGIPVFVKQLGTYLAKELQLSDRHGKNIEDFPDVLQVRQFPILKTSKDV